MLNDLLNIFFPKACYACSNYLQDNEHTICTQCRHDLPVTNFHFTNNDFVKKVFYGRVQLEQATALFRFEKRGLVQQLIHNLKYRNQEAIGVFLGKWIGSELKASDNYNTIDCVISVPLHKRKLRKRGYNQVTKFGQEIAKALNIEYLDNVLVKITNTKSQVKKNRVLRWQTNNTLFAIKNNHLIAGKHVLLVDDIITSGATMEACCLELNKAKNVKISLTCMAIA